MLNYFVFCEWFKNKLEKNNKIIFQGSSIELGHNMISEVEDITSAKSRSILGTNLEMSLFERFGTNLENPFNRMISDTASYFLFIAILLLVLVNPQDKEGKKSIRTCFVCHNTLNTLSQETGYPNNRVCINLH